MRFIIFHSDVFRKDNNAPKQRYFIPYCLNLHPFISVAGYSRNKGYVSLQEKNLKRVNLVIEYVNNHLL